MSHRPAISAIVCTHNRVSYLEGSISSLHKQTLPAEEFEIIVVDNRSTDDTADWCRRTAERVPHMRYVFEPQLGLTHARNTGWRSAEADIVAFLDDDAVAAADWLEVLVTKFGAYDARVAGIGGKVAPLWESPPPGWLLPSLWPYLSVLDWGSRDITLDGKRYFVGANMAFRKSGLARVNGFHGDLGRRGNALLSNEETHLKSLLEDAGYVTMYTPDATVAHSVPRARLSKHWFRRRHYWQGVSDVVMEGLQTSSSPEASVGRRFLRQSRLTAGLALDGARRGPRWILGRDAIGEFAWHYQFGRVVAGWQDLFSH